MCLPSHLEWNATERIGVSVILCGHAGCVRGNVVGESGECVRHRISGRVYGGLLVRVFLCDVAGKAVGGAGVGSRFQHAEKLQFAKVGCAFFPGTLCHL